MCGVGAATGVRGDRSDSGIVSFGGELCRIEKFSPVLAGSRVGRAPRVRRDRGDAPACVPLEHDVPQHLLLLLSVWCLAFGAFVVGCGVQGLGSRVWDLGCGVQVLGALDLGLEEGGGVTSWSGSAPEAGAGERSSCTSHSAFDPGLGFRVWGWFRV